MKADPFDVQMADGQSFADEVMASIAALPRKYVDGKPSRWLDIGDGWLLIDHLERKSGKYPRWEGTLLRVRKEELPNRSGPRGISDLDLEEDEGLGEHVAFLYDEHANLLWLQRDRRVAGKLFFMDYVRDRAGVSVAITVRLRKDAVKRARKLKNIRKITFGYLTSDTVNPQGRLERILDKLTGYGAARIDVTLTPVRGGTLSPKSKELVEGLGGEVEDESGRVEKAQISGRYEDDEEKDTFIDLIRDRMPMAVKVPRDRRRDPLKLIAAVREIWSENRTKV